MVIEILLWKRYLYIYLSLIVPLDKALHDIVKRIKDSGYFNPNKSTPEESNEKEQEEEEEEEEEESSGTSTPNGELSDEITTEQPQPQVRNK